MKISKNQLKQLIKEELRKVLQEEDWEDRPDMYSLERGYQGALVPPREHRSKCEKLTIKFLSRMAFERKVRAGHPSRAVFKAHDPSGARTSDGFQTDILRPDTWIKSWTEDDPAKIAAKATTLCAQNPRFHCKDPRISGRWGKLDMHPECKDEQKWSAEGTTKYVPSKYVDKYGRQRQGAGVAQPPPEGE